MRRPPVSRQRERALSGRRDNHHIAMGRPVATSARPNLRWRWRKEGNGDASRTKEANGTEETREEKKKRTEAVDATFPSPRRRTPRHPPRCCSSSALRRPLRSCGDLVAVILLYLGLTLSGCFISGRSVIVVVFGCRKLRVDLLRSYLTVGGRAAGSDRIAFAVGGACPAAGLDMEGGVSTEKKSSYTYWVREASVDAAPLPEPHKLSAEDVSKQAQQPPNTLGSVWNQLRHCYELDEAPDQGPPSIAWKDLFQLGTPWWGSYLQKN
ncbi:hypothetical protein Taro_026777 [Colocasia esculenta]|uniref:Uncharacterized protein n=1 Tax=Colocasia esculenta TaxID=4460 RepID=A0A843VLM1_COLES|nr:hypothetical protein [Colocasia esculenta]